MINYAWLWIDFDIPTKFFKWKNSRKRPSPSSSGTKVKVAIFGYRVWSQPWGHTILSVDWGQNCSDLCCRSVPNRQILSLEYNSAQAENWIRSWSDNQSQDKRNLGLGQTLNPQELKRWDHKCLCSRFRRIRVYRVRCQSRLKTLQSHTPTQLHVHIQYYWLHRLARDRQSWPSP